MITTPLYRIRDKVNKEYCISTILVANNGRLFDALAKINDENLNPDNYIIERCTGIQDKHKNWIYEGDIYKVDGTTFSKDGIEIEPTVNNIIEFIADFTDRDFGYSEERIEVVGNIHN